MTKLCLVGTVAEDSDLLHLVLVDREDVAFVLEEDDGLLRDQESLVLEFLALPRNVFVGAEFLSVIRAGSVHEAESQHGAEVCLRASIPFLMNSV